MRFKRHEDEPLDYTTPASESIDEALARLARQDKRLNPEGPPTAVTRAIGPSRAARDRIWTGLRWLIVLGAAWAFWRFVIR